MTATQTASAQDHRLGFLSQEQETEAQDLPVRGTLPSWLRGTLVRTGPAKFEVGEQRYRHWFDGLAMLHRFGFADGRASYANRFLRTRAYTAASESGRISYAEFATDPCRTLFQRAMSLFSPDVTDNASVNVVRLGQEYIAMTETPMPVAFDPQTLRTLGVTGWSKRLRGQLTTAHPHYEPERGAMLNYTVKFGPRTHYHFYELAPGGAPREIARIPVSRPSYMHSFAMTERYLVLAEYPFVVNPPALAMSGRPFIENYAWEPERGTHFLVVDRHQGTVRARVQGPAMFCFHHVNAFEDGDELALDLCAYDDSSVVQSLYLDRLRGGGSVPRPELRRYRVPLDGGEVTAARLADESLELPRINYPRHNARRYRFAYGTGPRADRDFLNQLVKADVESGEARTWSEDGCYPGEPVFVPAPEAAREDDGAILSVVLDARAESSFLLVLAADSFEELARAQAPLRIPFGFHGSFFRD